MGFPRTSPFANPLAQAFLALSPRTTASYEGGGLLRAWVRGPCVFVQFEGPLTSAAVAGLSEIVGAYAARPGVLFLDFAGVTEVDQGARLRMMGWLTACDRFTAVHAHAMRSSVLLALKVVGSTAAAIKVHDRRSLFEGELQSALRVAW